MSRAISLTGLRCELLSLEHLSVERREVELGMKRKKRGVVWLFHAPFLGNFHNEEYDESHNYESYQSH